jgi:hypothetical protein
VSLNAAYVECDLWRETPPPSLAPDRVLFGFDLPPIKTYREKLGAS